MLKMVNGAILTCSVIIIFFTIDVNLHLNRAGIQLKLTQTTF